MLFILNKIFNLLLSGVLIISSCKYDVCVNNNIYKMHCPIVYIYSYDPCGYITTLIKNRLRTKNIVFTDYKKNIEYKKSPYTILHIIRASERCIRTTIFQNGESAEYRLTLTVTVKIKKLNEEYRLFNIKTFRSFFENPMMILSNSVKKNNVLKIIYEEAAEELINTLCFYK